MMKINKIMKSLIMIMLIFLPIMMSGCSGEDSEKYAVAIVIGVHNNSEELNLNVSDIQQSVSCAVGSYGYVSVIAVDGKPEIVAGNTYEIPDQAKSASKTKLKSDAEAKTGALLAELPRVVADDEEVDTLEAIRQAVLSFAYAPGNCSKTIIIMDTGLSTTGVLNFRNNLLNADPNTVAEELYARNEIPDLKGITVKWWYMGNVAYPQEPLSANQRKQLMNIWKAIIEKGGGKLICNDMPSADAVSNADLPKVSVVDLTAEPPIAYETADTFDKELLDEPIALTEEVVSFVPDSDSFLDEAKARSAVNPIADALKDDRRKILIIGCTAGDENTDFAKQLSEDRAAAVKRLLTEMGVDEDQMTAIGMGSADPWHIYGVGTESETAKANRKVVLIDAESEDAGRLLRE
jgi:Outer membrane protein and related peptidoglycan-associated (lipo)proteins